MSGHDTLRRDGGWTVELITPVKTGQGDVSIIDISPPSFNHVIRWGSDEIPSTLALLSELSGVSEATLKALTYPDVNRVMKAFYEVLPPELRSQFEKGAKPLATPADEMTDAQLIAEQRASVDQVDPRFPAIDGPVTRVPKELVDKAFSDVDEADDNPGIKADAPSVLKAVG